MKLIISLRVIANNGNPHIFADMVSSGKRRILERWESIFDKYWNLIFNEFIENVEQMKLKSQK